MSEPNADKFSWGPGEAVLPQCTLCKHLGRSSRYAACAAFPGGEIPDGIRLNQIDHRRPWVDPETGEPGDTGISGARSITFTPAPGVSGSALEALYRHLDKIKG